MSEAKSSKAASAASQTPKPSSTPESSDSEKKVPEADAKPEQAELISGPSPEVRARIQRKNDAIGRLKALYSALPKDSQGLTLYGYGSYRLMYEDLEDIFGE